MELLHEGKVSPHLSYTTFVAAPNQVEGRRLAGKSQRNPGFRGTKLTRVVTPYSLTFLA